MKRGRRRTNLRMALHFENLDALSDCSAGVVDYIDHGLGIVC